MLLLRGGSEVRGLRLARRLRVHLPSRVGVRPQQPLLQVRVCRMNGPTERIRVRTYAWVDGWVIDGLLDAFVCQSKRLMSI